MHVQAPDQVPKALSGCFLCVVHVICIQNRTKKEGWLSKLGVCVSDWKVTDSKPRADRLMQPIYPQEGPLTLWADTCSHMQTVCVSLRVRRPQQNKIFPKGVNKVPPLYLKLPVDVGLLSGCHSKSINTEAAGRLTAHLQDSSQTL